MNRFRLISMILVAIIALGSFGMALAQDATELTLWVFVDRHGLYMVNQAERWNEAHPERPIALTYEQIDYTQMHDNLLASLLVGMGAPRFGGMSKSASSPPSPRATRCSSR